MTSAPDLQSGFSRDYVAFMRCDAGDGWLPEVESQIASWLRKKRLDIAVDRDGELVQGDARVAVRRVDSGGAHDLRLSLVERNPAGTFTTELLAHDEASGEDWISLTVRNDRGGFVDVPNLAKFLMEVLPLGEGAIQFSATPQVVRIGDVDWLADLLADDERHSLVFVAGTAAGSGIPVDAFVSKVGVWSRRVFGLGQVIVLDPAATEAFAARVGPRFAAHPWTIRTYRPGARYDSDLDSRRHRFLATSSLANQSDGRISYLLGDVARNHAAARPEPPAVQRVRRRFERIENRKLVEALEPVPSADPHPVSPEKDPHHESQPEPPSRARKEVAEVGLIKTVLGIKEVTEATLREIAGRLSYAVTARDRARHLEQRLDELQSRVEEVEDERDGALAAIKDEQFALEITELDLEKQQERVRWLTARLEDHNDFETGYLDVPDKFATKRPSDFGQLLERIETIPGVVFTGDPDLVVRLAAIDTNETALRVAWDGILLLADYVKARDCGDWEHGLDKFVQETPDGYVSFPPGKFANNETGVTMRSWGKERIFPVPREVESSGRIEMPAHFKLARIGRKHPRMHVYDAHPHHPMVCIGYIGPHLTNTHT